MQRGWGRAHPKKGESWESTTRVDWTAATLERRAPVLPMHVGRVLVAVRAVGGCYGNASLKRDRSVASTNRLEVVVPPERRELPVERLAFGWVCVFVLVVLPMTVAAQGNSMDFESASEIGRASQSPEVDRRRTRAGIAGSSIGLAAGLLGIAMGGVFLAQSNRTECGPTTDACEGGILSPDASRRAGTAFLVVSPLVFGASVFGLVRSRRRLNQDKERGPARP